MGNFKLQNGTADSYTIVQNNFIEKQMPKAPGEYVKIFIYLLKCVSQNCSELSITKIADTFDITEKDVLRALRYWQGQGLLCLVLNEDESIKSLTLSSTGTEEKVSSLIPATAMQEGNTGRSNDDGVIVFPAQKQYSKNELEAFSKDGENTLTIYAIQKLIGRPLNGADINTIMFFEESLGFSKELIEYLFEYCANRKKTNIRYIEKTAMGWHEQGIRDIKGAKMLNTIYSDNCYPVMKAFGLTGRNPAEEECKYVGKWIISYGFSLEIILEACNKTINTIHQPSFEYTDSILRNWKSAGISTIEEIRALDAEHSLNEAAKRSFAEKTRSSSKPANTGFNNFHQRSYDYDQLESMLISK